MTATLEKYQRLPVGVLLLDSAWKIKDTNQIFCHLFDCDENEILHKPFQEVLPPDDRKDILLFFRKMKEGGSGTFYLRLELRLKNRDYLCRIRATEEDGDLILFVERLEVDQKLKDQLSLMKKRWTVVHEFIEDGVLVVDSEFKICELNGQLLQALELSDAGGLVKDGERLIGKSLFAFLDEKDFPELRAGLEACRLDSERVFDGRYQFKSKLINIRTSSIYISRGKFQGRCLIVRDLTDQSRTEEMLLKKTIVIKLLQSVAVASNEAKTAAEALKAAVENVCLYTGWPLGHVYLPAKGSPNELISSDIWFPERGAANEAIIQAAGWFSFHVGEDLPGRVMRSGRPEWAVDLNKEAGFLRAKLVSEHGIRCSFAFPVILSGEVAAILEFFSPHSLEMDHSLMETSIHLGAQLARVFERENAQAIIGDQQVKIAANSKLSALGEMAGGIAHEINNPLAVIHTLAGQLRELATENEVDQKVVTKISTTIESTAMRIAKIIKGLRSFARDGESDPLEPVSIRSIVEDTMAFCVERLKNRGITISFKDHGNDMKIHCRGVQIAQVLLNLINNAHDAIGDVPEKWIMIETWERGNYLEMTVTDCGTGIPIEHQDRIFQPFFTTKEIGKGTGMGLSISRAIINDHLG